MATRARRKTKPTRRGKFIKVALSVAGVVFLSATTLGVIAGRQMSPAYADPTLGPSLLGNFLLAEGALELGSFRVEKDSLDRTVLVERPISSVQFVCDPAVYVYKVATNLVTQQSVTHDQVPYAEWLHNLRKPLPSLDTALLALVGGAGGTAAYNAREAIVNFSAAVKAASRIERVRLVLIGIGSLASGGALGFWWSYEPIPRCGENAIKETLKSAMFWKSVWERERSEMERSFRWEFQWDQKEPMRLLAVYSDGEPVLPDSNSTSLPSELHFRAHSLPKKVRPTLLERWAASSDQPARYRIKEQARNDLVCGVFATQNIDLAWRLFALTERSTDYEDETKEGFHKMTEKCDSSSVVLRPISRDWTRPESQSNSALTSILVLVAIIFGGVTVLCLVEMEKNRTPWPPK